MTVLLVAAGGAAGACARYGIWLVWPSVWGTFAVNVAGCSLIGVLMVLAGERGRGPDWVRPLLGTGVLGGFTTFSAYSLDVVGLLERGALGTALGYALGTLAGALGAVWLAVRLTRLIPLTRPIPQ
ncbi:CrcB family protein [Streptomyces sp. NPDC002054]|uniref:fluoride efflux transporter FluC n=1 Tax=Streptomyces sp. NPDC002054 TaxID=3154663 RepID=UPI00333347B5